MYQMRYKEIYNKYIIKIYHTQHDIAKTFFVDFVIRVNENHSFKNSGLKRVPIFLLTHNMSLDSVVWASKA